MYPREEYLNKLISRKDNGRIKNETEVLDILLDVLASGIGSLTNPSKLANTFKSERGISIGSETIERYLKPWRDEAGIIYMGIEQFLLDEDVLK